MPVFRGEEIETISPFDGFELKRIVDKTKGSKTITFIAETLHPGGKIPVHRHNVEGALYVLAGTGYLTIEDEKSDIEPGMGILVPANSWYSLGNDGIEDLKWVTAHPSTEITKEEK